MDVYDAATAEQQIEPLTKTWNLSYNTTFLHATEWN